MSRLTNETLENAIKTYKTVVEACDGVGDDDYCPILDKVTVRLLEELKEYRKLEEQGLLLKLKQVSVNDVVDKLFSHNEIISLWREVKDEVSYHKRIWYGMAWDIPEELKNCKFVKIFGTIPESIVHADIINIEVLLSAEAENALAEMEK